jgi:hypothetical protein
MLVNITKTFDDASGRRRYIGENPDIDPVVARKWIDDGYATADVDGVADAPAGGGGGITSASGKFLGITKVSVGQSIQAAVDAVPAGLVTSLTTGFTLVAGAIYSIPNTTVPNRLYIDDFQANRFYNVDEFLNGTTADEREAGYFGGYSQGWCHDPANSRILIYSASGSAPAKVTLRNDWLIVLGAGHYQQRVRLAPGVLLQGAGRTLTSMQADPLTPALANIGDAGKNIFTVCCSDYSEVRGIWIQKTAPDPSLAGDSNTNVTALAMQFGYGATQFVARDCLISDVREVTGITYVRSITFFPSGTGKNMLFDNTPIYNDFGEDAIETQSSGFTGSIEFRGGDIRGGYFFDGNSQAILFTNLNTSAPQENGRARLTGSEGVGNTFSANIGGNAVYSGHVYEFIARNCKLTVNRQLADQATQWAGWQAKNPMLLENTDVVADGLVFASGSAQTSGWLKADYAKKLTVRGGKTPPLPMYSFLAAQPTPLVPVCYVGVTKTNSTSVALETGCFSMTYENLQIYRKARVEVKGTFAANANTKTLDFRAGLVGSLASLNTSAGAHNGLAFASEILLEADPAGVQVTISGSVGSGITFSWTYWVAVTAGQTFGFQVNCTGVASSDISVKTQRIELG